MARDVLAKARRLALVAQSALRNGDLQRASSVRGDLETATSIEIGRRLVTALPDAFMGPTG